MKTRLQIAIFLLTIFMGIDTPTFPQQGIPFLSNIAIPSSMSNQSWGVAQNDQGVMLFLNRKGIYTFDGFEWEKLKIEGRPLAMYYHNSLFFSTYSNIGYATRNPMGEYDYFHISDTLDDFFHTFISRNDELLAVGAQHIVHVLSGSKPQLIPLLKITDPTKLISHAFALNDSIFYILNGINLFMADGLHSKPISLSLGKGEEVKFVFNHQDVAIIGTSNSNLFSFNGQVTTPLKLKDEKYITASRLNGGTSIDSTRFALATQLGGCVIVNAKTLESVVTLNYANGLLDDEVFALAMDRGLGLWISHAMGITRADLHLPIKSYHHLSGLSGSVLSVAQHRGDLYLGTSEGVFQLIEEKDYKAVEVTVRPRPAPKVPVRIPEEVSPPAATVQPEEEGKKRRRGFFSRIFERSERKEEADQKAEALRGTHRETQEETSKELEPAKRMIYSLQSVTHRYRKVKGVSGKCWQIIDFEGTLIAVTSTGLYEINRGEGKAIVAGVYSLHATPSSVHPNSLFLCSYDGVWLISKHNNSWEVLKTFSLDKEMPLSVVDIEPDAFYVTTELGIFKVFYSESGFQNAFPLASNIEGLDNPVIRRVNDGLKIFTSDRLYSLCAETDSFSLEFADARGQELDIIYSQQGMSWLRKQGKWRAIMTSKSIAAPDIPLLTLFNDVNDIFMSSNGDIFLVNGFKQVFKIASTKDSLYGYDLNLFARKITDSRGNRLNLKEIVLDYSNNGLKVRISAPFYLKEKSIEFRHYISGVMGDWSEWSNNSVREFPYLPNGRFTISIEARDIFGNTSEVYEIPFRIKPPFWKTVWFMALCAILLIAVIILLVRVREQQLIKEKRILERKVKDRTKTIEAQKEILMNQRDELKRRNEEIIQQKEEIEAQRDEIEVQRDQIFKQNEDIKKSIEYAKRIQTAVMTPKEHIDRLIPEHYLIFRPRDIVSGDFYWVNQRDGKLVMVVADCTGHGVPGAFMSMLGISFLNEIVTGGVAIEPHEILNTLRARTKSTLSQTGREGENRDGMDMVVCVFDPQTSMLQFAGAYNPLYLVSQGEIVEYKPDKMPVGIHLNEKESFTINEIPIRKGDQIVMFSDGFIDQFGGADGRKYMSRHFKRLLASIYNEPVDVQKRMLEEAIDSWMAGYPQVDDIVIMGVRF